MQMSVDKNGNNKTAPIKGVVLQVMGKDVSLSLSFLVSFLVLHFASVSITTKDGHK